MSQFFIRRPIFAWVIALFIILLGVLSIPKLPIARFPIFDYGIRPWKGALTLARRGAPSA